MDKITSIENENKKRINKLSNKQKAEAGNLIDAYESMI
jgi:hypothetical protein